MMLRTLITGLLMGAAELVPGVSGGTVAFVSGLYERLVKGISRLTPLALLELPKQGIGDWWRNFDMSFLSLLFGAMAVAVLALAGGVTWLLEQHPIPIWSFFFGLVLASILVATRRFSLFKVSTLVTMGLGVAFGLIMTQLTPASVEVTPLALFCGGCIAVCAWILPGVSGSFILLTLGLYQTVITAIRDLNFLILLWLGLGCLVGILAFSRVLSNVLARFHDETVALLTGFMAGSLLKVWPWKYTRGYQFKADGSQIPLVQEPVLPGTWQQLTGAEPGLLFALLACLLGMGVILAMDRFALLAETDAGKGK